jgi:hypothetical protein
MTTENKEIHTQKDVLFGVPGTDKAPVLFSYAGDRYYTPPGSIRDLLRVPEGLVMSMIDGLKNHWGTPHRDFCKVLIRAAKPGEGRTDDASLGSGNLFRWQVSERLTKLIVESCGGQEFTSVYADGPNGPNPKGKNGGKNKSKFDDWPTPTEEGGLDEALSIVLQRQIRNQKLSYQK